MAPGGETAPEARRKVRSYFPETRPFGKVSGTQDSRTGVRSGAATMGPRSRVFRLVVEHVPMLATLLGLAAGSGMAWKTLSATSQAKVSLFEPANEPVPAWRPLARL